VRGLGEKREKRKMERRIMLLGVRSKKEGDLGELEASQVVLGTNADRTRETHRGEKGNCFVCGQRSKKKKGGLEKGGGSLLED